MIPRAELFASSVLHPADDSMAWLLHSRRTPLLPNSRGPCVISQGEVLGNVEQSSARDAISPSFSGIGDPHETAYICYDCARCLCVEDTHCKMPEYALANGLWLGRVPVDLQNVSLGLRMLLGLGRLCFRKQLLGKWQKGTLQSGLKRNHMLVSQASPSLGESLPPSSRI